MPDWEAIKRDYENGLSQRSLSAKYDVPKTTILRRAQSENWTRTAMDRIADQSGPVDQPPASSTVALASSMITQLATIAKVPLDLKEHNLFAQALSQYNKIVVTGVDATSTPPVLDWSIFEQSELDIIQPIFSAAEERKRIADGENNIPQLRKQV